jgi:hypothetical protein
LCQPVISPSTTRTGRSGEMTSSVQPRAAMTNPSGRVADSMARVAVVPTAMIRWPRPWAALTSWAAVSLTSNHSAWGASWASCEDTPVCRVIGAKSTPRATNWVTSSALNGRAALGISALPGHRPKIVWYAAIGKRSRR